MVGFERAAGVVLVRIRRVAVKADALNAIICVVLEHMILGRSQNRGTPVPPLAVDKGAAI